MINVHKLKNIKAVGFDVDGTLYSMPDEVSAQFGQEIIRLAAEQLKKNEDEFAEEYLAKREELRSNTMTLNSFGLNGEEIFQRIFDEFPIEKFAKRDVRLIKAIAKLKKRYRLFIISNGTGRQVERKLKILGLDKNDFEPRIYCYDQGWLKPEPAPFLAAIESLALLPEEIVYVGDREDVDIQGAQAVGMKTIYMRGESKIADAFSESVYDIEKLFFD